MSILTALGKVNYHYWHQDGIYYREHLTNGFQYFWNGSHWVGTAVNNYVAIKEAA